MIRHRLATALERHVTHVLGVDTRGPGHQRGFHPVLTTDRTAGAKHHLGRVGLECGHDILEALVRRICTHDDRAIVGPGRAHPPHVINGVASVLADCQIEQRAAGKRDNRPRFIRTLRDHCVVGHCADTARHVGHAHRFGEDFFVDQCALYQLAGQVETAAGLGRGDALGALGLGQQLAAEGEGTEGQGDMRQGSLHDLSPVEFYCGLPDRQAVADAP